MEDSDLDFIGPNSSDNNHYNLYGYDTSDAFEPIGPFCYICGYEVGIASGIGWSVAGMKKANLPPGVFTARELINEQSGYPLYWSALYRLEYASR